MSKHDENYRSEIESSGYKDFKRAMKDINKELTKKKKGEIELSPLGEIPQMDVETISSGSIVLDNLAGGGFPVGRIIEIYGPESSGKTSIALNAIADVQRKGGNALFIDAEQALDPSYAEVLGVDVEKLGITQLIIAERVFATIRAMIETGTVDLIVLDTVASIIPKDEFTNPEKPTMALLARIMSKQLRLIAKIANENSCTVIFLNQIREKVGVMFGSPETTPGGKALKFYASQRIRVRRSKRIKEGNEFIGTEMTFKIVKNKIAPPFGEGTTVLTFDKGINRPAEIIEVGGKIKALDVEGRTQYLKVEDPSKYEDEFEIDEGRVKLGTSKKMCISALEDNEDLFKEAAKRVEEVLKERRQGGRMDDNEDPVESDEDAFTV